MKGSADCQLRSSLRDAKCFISFLELLTMNSIRISITKYSKAIVVMNQNLHSTLPLSTSKIQAIIYEPWSLYLGRMKSESHYWKLFKTIPLAKLAFQSYSIGRHTARQIHFSKYGDQNQNAFYLAKNSSFKPYFETHDFKMSVHLHL